MRRKKATGDDNIPVDLLKELSKRLESKIEEVTEEDQFEFQKGKGSRDAIELMSIKLEMCLTLKKRCVSTSQIGKQFLTMLIGPNCWKCLEISELTGGNVYNGQC